MANSSIFQQIDIILQRINRTIDDVGLESSFETLSKSKEIV